MDTRGGSARGNLGEPLQGTYSIANSFSASLWPNSTASTGQAWGCVSRETKIGVIGDGHQAVLW